MRWLCVVGALVLLAGCKAEMVEVRLSAKDILAAIGNEVVMVPFEATFTTFGKMDAEKRAQMEHVEEIASRYLEIEDFQLRTADSKTVIEIEGMLPVVAASGAAAQSSAYVIVINDNDDPALSAFPYSVSLETGAKFGAMEREMHGVNFMLAPDENHPVQFRIRGGENEMRLLAGGFELDGQKYATRVVDLPAGKSVALTFRGGAYDDVGGGFLISAP